MAILATIKGWFRRERKEPLERPRDLPPRPEGGRPAPHPQDVDNAIGWRQGGGVGGF